MLRALFFRSLHSLVCSCRDRHATRDGVSRPRLWRVSMALLAMALVLPFSRPVLALDAPSLLTPADGATIQPSEDTPLAIPEFTWQEVEGATTYRIEFCQDSGFGDTRFSYTTANTSYTPTASSKFPDGIWYWRVKVENPSEGSFYSPARSFTKEWASATNNPTLLYPAEGATLDFYTTDTFSWEAVTGAATYRFQIASSADGFSTPLYNAYTLAPVHQPTTKLANGTYYWRVIPRDPNDRQGTTSAVREFTVSYALVPQLIEPEDDATPTFTPTLRWSAVQGAQYYRLEYSTDPSFGSGVTAITTRNTTYTPTDDVPNDVNYYWRARVHSGQSVGPWSEVRSFVKRWYLQPALLTPTNAFQYVQIPFFSWTPVPGARRYKYELNDENVFGAGAGVEHTGYTANPFYYIPAGKKVLTPSPTTWYWRITPMDADGNEGKASDVFSFRYTTLFTAPQLASPLYYYVPNAYAGAGISPYEDRTAALPVFQWHRCVSDSGVEANAYRVQVSSDPLFLSVDWTVDTENLCAAPTDANPFEPVAGTDYFWRVTQLDGVDGAQVGVWSQIWRTRFDDSLLPDAAAVPAAFRPEQGAEWVELMPLLEWQPVAGADSYEVEIGKDVGFASGDVVISDTVTIPAFAPTERPAYEGDPGTPLPYGTYYWRIRAVSASTPGDWSGVQRFQVAAQSRWDDERTVGDAANQIVIASDAAGDMTDANYDLSTLWASQDPDNWYFGFHVGTGAEDMTYALYIDLDHEDGSGATADARGFDVSALTSHRPEYAIYVLETASGFVTSTVGIYGWTDTGWDTPVTLESVGGSLAYDAGTGSLEIMVPNTVIGMEGRTSSAAVSLFSARTAGGHAQDTVPSDPDVAYSAVDTSADTTVLSRFASVSDRLALIAPPNLAATESTADPSVLPLFWHPPVGVEWYGFQVYVSTDPEFTSMVLDYTYRTNVAGRDPCVFAYDEDLNGDNTYYWRVRPIYNDGGDKRGAWSEGSVFEREGFVPQSLQTSVDFATPSFSWDMVEGAQGYDLQVSTDPEFGSTSVNVTNIARNSYTPTSTLSNALYYWRVRARRHDNILNDWSSAASFTLTLPVPENLQHTPSGEPDRAPTLSWHPLIVASGGTDVLAAWKYKVEVSREPTFSSIWDSITTEQACWTPTKGYHDGTYYWHVAMIDGNGRMGDYCDTVQFTKAYGMPTLVSPAAGASAEETPTFSWEPVTGAAKYKLEVSVYDNFSRIYNSVTTNNVRYTPTKAYDTPQTYYWRVYMIDDDGRTGPTVERSVVVSPYPDPSQSPYAIFLPVGMKD